MFWSLEIPFKTGFTVLDQVCLLTNDRIIKTSKFKTCKHQIKYKFSFSWIDLISNVRCIFMSSAVISHSWCYFNIIPLHFQFKVIILSNSYYWSLRTAIPVCCESGSMCSIQCIAVSSRFLFITCKVGFHHI